MVPASQTPGKSTTARAYIERYLWHDDAEVRSAAAALLSHSYVVYRNSCDVCWLDARRLDARLTELGQ